MANVNVTIRLDEDLKREADALFDELGMSFTTAVNIFVRQSLREKRIPFDISTRPQIDYASIHLEDEQPAPLLY